MNGYTPGTTIQAHAAGSPNRYALCRPLMRGVSGLGFIVNNEKVHKYLAYLDGRASTDKLEAIAKLEALGANIPSLLMKKYKISRRWSDRASCVYHCVEYAKTNEDAYQLGIIALHDKSKIVRRRACMLLSVAQKQEAVKHLEDLLFIETSRDDAVAAINALMKLNKN